MQRKQQLRSKAVTLSDIKAQRARFFIFFSMFVVLTFVFLQNSFANILETTFSKSDKTSEIKVDNSLWNKLLKQYVTDGPDRLNVVDYAAFKKNGHNDLKAYVALLESTDVAALNRKEQYAFWLNLYNAKTIDVVLDHYPTNSIRDIDISPGLFSDGPWGKKVTKVNGVDLSLDDIEHNILRKLWNDPRVHYGVNCASIGCPNLAREAYTGDLLDVQLNKSAIDFVNSPRGVRIDNGNITVSKIYRWFKVDFGSSESNTLKHIRKYAKPDLKAALHRKTRIYNYEYDWALNNVKSGT
ncbi:MAG: DUF547 domain-containing protein [Pseudomonadota bacterium]